MIKYTRQLKSKIFKIINSQPVAFNAKDGDWDNDGIIRFLNNIWDLKTMPIVSGDTRWSNAYEDAVQHLVNNPDDWSYEQTFLDYFKLLEKDEDFTKFLETVVHPNFRNDLEEINLHVSLINLELSAINYTMAVSDYQEDLPIYTLRERKQNDRVDLLINTIPFVVDENNSEYPYFYLFSNDWDDYGSKTKFKLLYHEGVNNVKEIGYVKITDGVNDKTIDVIDKKFTNLKDSFCSLGTNEEYYTNLQSIFKHNFQSVLFALKDSAFFIDINDKFSSNSIYQNSLTRDDSTEQFSRNIKHILEGRSLDDKYKFKYSFIPNYSETPVEIDLNFKNTLEFSDRIFAVIGRNGAGKTQLITSLPIDISEQNLGSFSPEIPIFSKVIAVSYSVFDSFKKPNQHNDFNYVFCGLLNEDNNIPNKREKTQSFLEAYKIIKRHNRVDKWKNVLMSFIMNDELDDVFIRNFNNDASDYNTFKIIESEFIKLIDKLSSGQSIMLEIMTKIIANIRYDSLILFDEPETHLHPNAISQLISSIYELVEQFDSYCLITTHSPIIIQNIFGKNVYVMEKDENHPILRKIGIECFGENLSVLTEDVFGNRDMQKQYKVILDRMIKQYGDYSQIVELIETHNLPLSLNAKVYLKSKTF
ncbi:AAA family ATPase [Wenyingzhuangia sp. 2_MG-2023]|nr:AAA family ATPase [Wenyingzhuangia sp. 2_MG-2023]MDO6737375.1 AAA family ATPase [Wenyingzhuangia sp. 2_MG-2023]